MEIKNYKIGIYVRVANKNDDVLKRQEEYALSYCRYREYPEVVKIYRDNGYSGNTENRPAYKRMLKDIRDGKINVIIVANFSRLTRQLIYFYHKMVDYITSNKLLIICLDNYVSDEKKSYTRVMLDVARMKEIYRDDNDGGVE